MSDRSKKPKKSVGQATERIQRMFMSPDKIPEPGPSVTAYNRVVATARLSRLFLVNADFRILPTYFDIPPDAEVESVIAQKLIAETAEPDQGTVNGVFHWSICVRDKGAADGDEHLALSASYYLGYDAIEADDKQAMLAFLGNVGKFATYPYFRSHVSQMSWAAEANLPLLPIIRDQR